MKRKIPPKNKIAAAMWALDREGNKITVSIRGPIFEESFYDEDEVCGVNNVISDVSAQKNVDEIYLQIFSRGGDFHAALALKSYFENHSATITASVFGMAASSATVVASAATHIDIGPDDFYLVHNPWLFAVGDYRDMDHARIAALGARDVAANIYQRRSNMEFAEVTALMDEDQTLSASRALELGLIDSIRDDSSTQASANVCVGPFCAPRGITEKLKNQHDALIGRTLAKSEMKSFQHANTPPTDDDEADTMKPEELQAKIDKLEADITTLKATASLSEKAVADKDKEIETLKASQMTDEEKEKLRADIRKEIEDEATETETVKASAVERGYKPEGSNPTDIMRSVVVESGMSAEAVKAFEGEQLKHVFDHALTLRKKTESDEHDESLLPDKDKPASNDDDVFAAANAVGIKK